MKNLERQRRTSVGWFLLAPSLLLAALFLLYPLGSVFYFSFSDPKFGLQNYIWFFNINNNVVVLVRTFLTAMAVSVICLILAYPYAYAMTRASPRIKALLIAVVLTPLWTSLMVRTIAWVVLLQDTGAINNLLAWLGFERIHLIRTSAGMLIGMTQMLMPFMVLPLYGVMSKIDDRYVRAAFGLGASGLTVFLRVYLPMTRPGITAGLLTVFVLGLGFYIIPSLLGSPSNTMMSALIQQQVGGLLAWGRGSAMGVILLVLTAICILLAAAMTRREKSRTSVGSETPWAA